MNGSIPYASPEAPASGDAAHAGHEFLPGWGSETYADFGTPFGDSNALPKAGKRQHSQHDNGQSNDVYDAVHS
jgi:hypothetical protein